MKKNIYLALSVLLFVLLGILLVSIIELLCIRFFVSDKNNFDLSWNYLITIRNIFSVVVVLSFSVLGCWVGGKWWKYVYVDKKYKIK